MTVNMPAVRSISAAIVFFFVAMSMCFGQDLLRIGPGDVVSVHVYDTPEMDQTARVTATGDTHLALIGDVHLAALTPQEAAHEIERVLIERKLMKYPSVVVNVTSYETENVSVTGEVNHPGAFQVTAARSVIDIISLSGGLTSLADRHILVRRKGTRDAVPFFFSNDPAEALRNDVAVEPGDTVIVPRVGVVYVLGDVGRPGGYPIDQPDSRMTVLKAIALAGATNHSASPAKARLVRKTPDGYQDIALQVSDMQKGKSPDMLLQPNDVLYIPFSYLKNAVALGSSAILSSATTAAIYAH